jgi:glycosyltransferase involved in cell wall biosynthesis
MGARGVNREVSHARKPLVSVVTPSYNQARFLEETIRSVLDQDYPRLEYVVVDGGSTDGSAEIVRRYDERLAWWTSEPDEGQASALNRGFARAQGEYLTWLSSDDTYLPGAISRLVEELETHPEAVLAYGDAYTTDEDSHRLELLTMPPPDFAAMVRRCECFVVQPASLFRRSAWEAAGPFVERYWLFDLEFFLKASALGPARQIREPLATYRLHAESKSIGTDLRKARAYVAFGDTVLTREHLPGPLRGASRRGRSTAYLRAGDYFYWSFELGAARRYLLKGLALDPRNASRRALGLALKSLLPRDLVRRLRARRHARR